MEIKFKNKSLLFDVLLRVAILVPLGFLLYDEFSSHIESKYVLHIIIVIYCGIPLFGLRRMGKTALKITDSELIYYDFKKPLKKENIVDFKIAGGRRDSYILIKLKSSETLEWYQFFRNNLLKNYGTSYRIMLHELDAEQDEVFGKLIEWIE